MRYCIDCTHYMLHEDGEPRCMRFAKTFVVRSHPVTGEVRNFSAPTCDSARSSALCGLAARNFDPRPGTDPWVELQRIEREVKREMAREQREASRRPWWRFW